MNPDGWKGPEALSGDELKAAFDSIVEPLDMTAKIEDLEIGQWLCVEHYRAGELVGRTIGVLRRKWIGDDGNTKIEFSRPTILDPRPKEITITVTGTIQ